MNTATTYDMFSCSSYFQFRKILPIEVQNAINELSGTSGAGLDGIENKFFKLSSHILVYPLSELFNLSLRYQLFGEVHAFIHFTREVMYLI